jgi:transposase InsO family protein
VHMTYQAPDIARVFFSEIVRLHGVPKRIISDRGSVFTRRFWMSFQEALGTQLNFSTAYHPETDGQTERMNQTLEDILRMYVMDQQKRWKEILPLVEFAYNNSYRAPLRWRRLSFFMGDRVGCP